jgi:hypothetical protein
MNHIQKYQLIKLAAQVHAPGSVGAFFQTDPIRQSPFPKSSKPPVQAEPDPAPPRPAYPPLKAGEQPASVEPSPPALKGGTPGKGLQEKLRKLGW